MNAPVDLPPIPPESSYDIVGFEQIQHDVVRRGAAYWLAKKGGRRLPSRDEIRPRDLGAILSHMSLIKVLGDDYKWRVAGDAVVRAYGEPIQNRTVSDLRAAAPKLAAAFEGFFARVVRERAPFVVRGQIGLDVSQANFNDFENALLPLGDDHETVDHIMVVSAYSVHPGRFRSRG